MKAFALISIAAAFVAIACYYEIPQYHYERYLVQRALREIGNEGPPRLYPHEKESLKRRLDKSDGRSDADHAHEKDRMLMGVLSDDQRLLRKLGHKSYHPQDYELLSSVKNIKKSLFRQLQASQAALTIENTEPLKIYYNWVNFDKVKSPPYRQCFETDAWYYKGSHKVTGPPSGNFERCADPNDQGNSGNFLKFLYQSNCWGKCHEKWVLTDDVVSYVKTSVEESLKELEATLRVPKLNGRLKFQKGPGSYPALYDSWGYSAADITKVRCHPDGYFSGAPFEESWCTEGLPAGYNFVLTITNSPPFNNDGSGGGTGGPSAFDNLGRPIAGSYQIGLALKLRHERSLNKPNPVEYGIQSFRHLSIHEAFHAIGFTINVMQNANMVHGPFKSYTDVENQGISDDSLWYLKPSTRSAKLAKVHFDCQDDTKWKGYPLMGKIEAGRDSHHNSFIFWEDVESYGDGSLITPITLAIFEDMGVYLADYSKSKVPNFGAFGGCDFVNTRCRHNDVTTYDDDTYSIQSSVEECNGWLNLWNGGGYGNYLLTNDYRLNKCNNNDYRKSCGLVTKCHPECIIRTSQNEAQYERWRPLINATGALPPIYPTLSQKAKEELVDSLALYIVPILLWVVASIALTLVYRCCHSLFESEEKMVFYSHLISSIFAAFGIAIMATAVYVIVMTDLYGYLLSVGAASGFALLGFVICMFGVIQYRAAKAKSTFAIASVAGMSSIVLIGQLIIVAYLVYFVSTFDSVDNAQVGTSSYERWKEHGSLSPNLKAMESYICKSYQKCCRDPKLLNDGVTITQYDANEGRDNNTQSNITEMVNITIKNKQACVTSHPGVNEAEQALLKLRDPSQEGFCEAIAGTENDVFISMSEGACQKMDESVVGFNRTNCQEKFCQSGIDGYNAFVHTMIDMARRNMYPFAMLSMTLAFVQIFQLILLLKLYRYHKSHPNGGEQEMTSVATTAKSVKISKKQDLQNRYRPQ